MISPSVYLLTSSVALPRPTPTHSSTPTTRGELTSSDNHHQSDQRERRFDLILVLLLDLVRLGDRVGRAGALGNLLVVLLKSPRQDRVSAQANLSSLDCKLVKGRLSQGRRVRCLLRAA